MKIEDIGLVSGQFDFKGNVLNYKLELPSFKDGIDTIGSLPDTDTPEGQAEWLRRERQWLVEHIVEWDLTERGEVLPITAEVIDRLPAVFVHGLFASAMEAVQKDQAPLLTSGGFGDG